MANYNRGKQHSLGYVAGSLFEGIGFVIASFVIFIYIFKMPSVMLTFVMIFAFIASVSFAVNSFSDFEHYKVFGSGTKGKIIFSINKKKSYDPELYSTTMKVSNISFTIALSSLDLTFIFLLIEHPWSGNEINIIFWVFIILITLILFFLLKTDISKAIDSKKEKAMLSGVATNHYKKSNHYYFDKKVGPVYFSLPDSSFMKLNGVIYEIDSIKNVNVQDLNLEFEYFGIKKQILCNDANEANTIYDILTSK